MKMQQPALVILANGLARKGISQLKYTLVEYVNSTSIFI